MKTRNKKNWNSLSMARKVNLELSFKTQSVTQNGGFPACNLHGELSFAFCKEASVELVKQRTAQTEAKDQQ